MEENTLHDKHLKFDDINLNVEVHTNGRISHLNENNDFNFRLSNSRHFKENRQKSFQVSESIF